jgi:hypothetical protein
MPIFEVGGRWGVRRAPPDGARIVAPAPMNLRNSMFCATVLNLWRSTLMNPQQRVLPLALCTLMAACRGQQAERHSCAITNPYYSSVHAEAADPASKGLPAPPFALQSHARSSRLFTCSGLRYVVAAFMETQPVARSSCRSAPARLKQAACSTQQTSLRCALRSCLSYRRMQGDVSTQAAHVVPARAWAEQCPGTSLSGCLLPEGIMSPKDIWSP